MTQHTVKVFFLVENELYECRDLRHIYGLKNKLIQSVLSCNTSLFLNPTSIPSPMIPIFEMTCGARKKTNTDYPSESGDSNEFQ